MDLRQLLLANAALFALVVSRIAGFVVASPFPGKYVSNTVRVTLVVVLAWVASSFASDGNVPRDLGPELVLGATTELGCGLVIGLVFRFSFAAAEVLGTVMAQATGLSSATDLNPALGTQDTVIDRVMTLGAMLVALSAGVHRVVLAYLLESFRALPVGADLSIAAAAPHFVDATAGALVLGVRMAMPVVAVSLTVQVSLALIARAAPALQIFNVGFAVMMVSGIATLVASLEDITAGLGAHFAALPHALDEVLVALARGKP